MCLEPAQRFQRVVNMCFAVAVLFRFWKLAHTLNDVCRFYRLDFVAVFCLNEAFRDWASDGGQVFRRLPASRRKNICRDLSKWNLIKQFSFWGCFFVWDNLKSCLTGFRSSEWKVERFLGKLWCLVLVGIIIKSIIPVEFLNELSSTEDFPYWSWAACW